jgi:hypothetical protein
MVLAVLLVVGAFPIHATFPGKNGRIALFSGLMSTQ